MYSAGFEAAVLVSAEKTEVNILKKHIHIEFVRVLSLCFLGGFVSTGLPHAFGQTTNVNSSITGTIRDASGSAITGVDITFTNLGNGNIQHITSNAAGKYAVYNIPPGSYEITTSKYGFAETTTRVAVDVHRQVHANLRLHAEKSTPPEEATNNNKSAEDKKIDALEARIDELEALLKQQIGARDSDSNASQGGANPSHAESTTGAFAPRGPLVATLSKDTSTPLSPGTASRVDLSKAVASLDGPNGTGGQQAAFPAPPAAAGTAPQNTAPPAPQVDTQTPFAYADFTWLNGTPRNKDTVLDTPFFTPEIRFDTNFILDFNQPIDHTMGGSTEEFRNGEFQVEDIGIGGDFHWQNVRGRVMFMDGMFAVTTPRNDASSATGSYPGSTGGVGQWDLQNAYKYVSEAYGGYHFNVQHGLNVDAGIFVSYVGLFSYYNFDNWTYQPSYVSSNTPWFFQGVRIQWFPTNKLKIEPWIIDGWQSYAKYNGHLGLGGQLLWMPKEWFKLVANQYGYGEDNLGLPHTQRIHTDDSIEIRFYNKPENLGISKFAMSLTGDAGCQYGGGITCTGGPNKSSFLGWMEYNRFWFHKDLFALTLGGGQMNNPGRYLTLLPPIDGAWAAVGSAYFPEAPGLAAKMYDGTITFQYMPREYITWWAEAGYRHSDVPYFSGRGGITPPGGDNGYPQYYTCMSGASAMTANLATAQETCGGANQVWFPDLRRSTSSLGFGVMVKF